MTKLLLITEDYAPMSGGVARYYKGLARACENITVLTNVVGEEDSRVIRASWTWPGWPRWFPLLWMVPRYKFKTGADVAAAGQILPIGTALWLMRLAFGWKYIVFLHGYDIALTQRNIWKSWLARRILRGAYGVVANSHFTKSLAVQAGARESNMIVLQPCTDLVFPADEAAKEKLRSQWQLSDKLVVLSVARLVPRKNIAQVVRAVAALQKEFPNLVYIVHGDGPERKTLEKLGEELHASSQLLGAIDSDSKELAAWYELADVFVLTPVKDPVDVESFGIVYLEAGLAGKPVIASDVGGVAEAVNGGGLLVASGDELVQALRNLLRNSEERKRLGEQGRIHARSMTWAAQATALRRWLDKSD